MERIADCVGLKELDRVVVTELIDSITVEDAVNQNGIRKQHILICYRFVGELSDDNTKDIA